MLLYEGNHAEWQAAICRHLFREGLSLHTPRNTSSKCVSADDLVRHTKAKSFILGAITQHLRNRLPESASQSIARLWKTLENLAQPFRLLDLPPQIRNTIYEFSMEHIKDQETTLAFGGAPAITRASRLLRQETMSPYCASVKKWLVHSDVFNRNPHKCTTRLHDWSRSLPKGVLRSITSLFFKIDLYARVYGSRRKREDTRGLAVERTLKIDFVPEGSMKMLLPGDFTIESANESVCCLRIAAENGRALGLEGGQAILYFPMHELKVLEWTKFRLES